MPVLQKKNRKMVGKEIGSSGARTEGPSIPVSAGMKITASISSLDNGFLVQMRFDAKEARPPRAANTMEEIIYGQSQQGPSTVFRTYTFTDPVAMGAWIAEMYRQSAEQSLFV